MIKSFSDLTGDSITAQTLLRLFAAARAGLATYDVILTTANSLADAGETSLAIELCATWVEKSGSLYDDEIYCLLGDLYLTLSEKLPAEKAYKSAQAINRFSLRATEKLASLRHFDYLKVRQADGRSTSMPYRYFVYSDREIKIAPAYYNKFGIYMDALGATLQISECQARDYEFALGYPPGNVPAALFENAADYADVVVIPSVFLWNYYNYYHTITDNVSRVVATIRKYGDARVLISQDQIALIEKRFGFNIFLHFMKLIGLESHIDVLPAHLSENPVVKLPQCATPRRLRGINSSGFLTTTAQTFHDIGQKLHKMASPHRRIFISRVPPLARFRLVHNEAEVMRGLEAIGFTRIVLEELTLEQQIVLFRDADFVIAPHGAGLTNMIFMRPHAQVIEITHEHFTDESDVFIEIAALARLDYHMYEAGFVKNAVTDALSQGDFAIDTPQLVDMALRILHRGG